MASNYNNYPHLRKYFNELEFLNDILSLDVTRMNIERFNSYME
jgi:hypothetical protein